MTNRFKLVAALSLALSFAPGKAQDMSQFPKEIQLVFEHMKANDYPEVFGGKSYQVRPIQWAITDIDNDGTTEVFLQTFPHFRQSPTITIFQISDATVKRVVEGLAPGKLIPLDPGDDYLDPHTTGTAVDLQLNSTDPEKMQKFATASLKFSMSVTLYKNFIHSDKRDGKPVFVDLSHLAYESDNDCNRFQFSKPSALVAGQISGSQEKAVVAVVEDELYCYRIKGFSPDGFLNKSLTILTKPEDFNGVIVDKGVVSYLTKANATKPLNLKP